MIFPDGCPDSFRNVRITERIPAKCVSRSSFTTWGRSACIPSIMFLNLLTFRKIDRSFPTLENVAFAPGWYVLAPSGQEVYLGWRGYAAYPRLWCLTPSASTSRHA